MNLISIIKGILNVQKKIDIKQLPSQGLFYEDDFEIHIKKAKIEDIIQYEHKYNKGNLGSIIIRLKQIVERNVILSENYTYNDIKSIDIVFIFLEIVKFTNGKPIVLDFFNDSIGKNEFISFESDNFNYFEPEDDLVSKYDSETKSFNFNGYKYSVPSIGLENSLTQFLIHKSDDANSEVYNSYSYDFLYFLGNKSSLTFNEIENLLQIFNFDLSDADKKYIRKIVKRLSELGRYSLRKDSQIIDVTAKIDLEKIWK